MDNKLRVVVSADTKSFVTGLNAASTKLKSFGNKAKDIGKSLSMSLTLPIGLVGGAAIKLASDFEESMNKVDVAFGQSSESVKDFAKTTLEQFGIAEGSALEMTSLFGDMATGMGIAQNDAANLSTSMVGLAGDLASFKNMNIEEVTTALSGVFTGETESLKRLGIVMTEVNLKQFAMEQGIKKNIKEMTQAEKVALRFQYILSVTGNAQGDFARTSGGAANQTRIFQESLKQLGQRFGNEILPLFTDVVKFLNKVIGAFMDLDSDTKKIIITAGLLAAAIPPLIAGFGQLSIVIGAVISPIGLIVAAFSTVTLVAVELLHRINPMVDRLNTFFNLIKSGGNIMSFQNLQIETVAKNLAEEHKQQEKLNEAKRKAKEDLDNLSKSYSNFQTTTSGRTQIQGLGANITTTGLQSMQTPEITASDDMSDLTNNFSSIEGKLRSVRNLAEQFGQSLMGAFETMGEGEPFFKVLMQMLGKLIKKLITAAIVSGVVSFAVNGIFGGGTLGFGAIFGSLSGIGGLSGLGGRSAFGEQSFVPKAISPGRTFGRLNANRSMKSNQLQGDFRLQGQDLVLALQRANTTRNRILG